MHILCGHTGRVLAILYRTQYGGKTAMAINWLEKATTILLPELAAKAATINWQWQNQILSPNDKNSSNSKQQGQKQKQQLTSGKTATKNCCHLSQQQAAKTATVSWQWQKQQQPPSSKIVAAANGQDKNSNNN